MAAPKLRRPLTVGDVQTRVYALVAMIGAGQFLMVGLDRVLPYDVMTFLWFVVGIGTAFASMLFEMYKSRQARWSVG